MLTRLHLVQGLSRPPAQQAVALVTETAVHRGTGDSVPNRYLPSSSLSSCRATSSSNPSTVSNSRRPAVRCTRSKVKVLPRTAPAVSPDGTRLASASYDRTTRVYAVDLDELVTLAQSRLTRWFTPDECRQYLHTDTCPPKP